MATENYKMINEIFGLIPEYQTTKDHIVDILKNYIELINNSIDQK